MAGNSAAIPKVVLALTDEQQSYNKCKILIAIVSSHSRVFICVAIRQCQVPIMLERQSRPSHWRTAIASSQHLSDPRQDGPR